MRLKQLFRISVALILKILSGNKIFSIPNAIFLGVIFSEKMYVILETKISLTEINIPRFTSPKIIFIIPNK